MDMAEEARVLHHDAGNVRAQQLGQIFLAGGIRAVRADRFEAGVAAMASRPPRGNADAGRRIAWPSSAA